MAGSKAARDESPRRGEGAANTERGFDFGEQQAIMVLSDMEFNKALTEAGVFGCAYGVMGVEGFSRPVPLLTLVGTNAAAFRTAFDHFAHWCAASDGDAVDVHILLRADNRYDLWIGPEIRRALYRLLPQEDLCRPLIVNLSWIKRFDSTHPMVRQLKRYLESAVSPICVGAGTADPNRPQSADIKPVEGVLPLVKFSLEIVEEAEAPTDPRFTIRESQDGAPRAEARSPLKPEEYCRYRKRTFDVAFPVSRERIRRTGLIERVHALRGYQRVSDSQVVQACLNLKLSGELVPGDRHYMLADRDLERQLWHHIFKRYETADGEPWPHLDPARVAHQIELDVRHVLAARGVATTRSDFGRLQASFLQRGFVDD